MYTLSVIEDSMLSLHLHNVHGGVNVTSEMVNTPGVQKTKKIIFLDFSYIFCCFLLLYTSKKGEIIVCIFIVKYSIFWYNKGALKRGV